MRTGRRWFDARALALLVLFGCEMVHVSAPAVPEQEAQPAVLLAEKPHQGCTAYQSEVQEGSPPVAPSKWDIAGDLVWAQLGPGPKPGIELVDAPRVMLGGRAVFGYARMGDWTAVLAAPGDPKPSETSLVHEFCHFWQSVAGFEPDGDHKGPCFRWGTGIPGMELDLRDSLKAAGL
jgi:hypothetical protein